MTIRTKLLLILVPLAAGAVLVTTDFSRRAVHGVVAGELVKRAIAAASAVALDSLTLQGYRTQSEAALLKPLTRLKENLDAESAASIAGNGRILAHTNVVEQGRLDEDPVIREVLRTGRPAHRIRSSGGRPAMVVWFPVLDRPSEATEDAFLFVGDRDQERLGVLSVSLPLEEALRVSARISTQVLMIVALVSSFALGLMLLVMGKVLAPIPQLVAATNSIGGGNLGATVPVRSRDEIGKLAESFNRMSRDLAETTVSREFLNNILTHMQDPVLVTHQDGTIRTANESAMRMLADPGSDLAGKRADAFVLVPEALGDGGIAALSLAPAGVDGGFRRMDGMVIPALVGASVLQDSDGRMQGYVVTGKDITELRRAQDELRHSVSLLRATLDSTGDGILVVDRDDRIADYNENFVNIWRIPQSIMEQRDNETAIALVVNQLEDPEAFLRKIHDLKEQPEAQSYDILTFKDGRILERYSRSQRIEGVSVGRVWSFRDITERRKAEDALRRSEEQLRQAQKMEAVGSLAGGVAHDFNNLLTIIKGYCQLQIRALGEGARGYREAVEVLKATERAASLTRQLLAFSRKQVLQPKVMDLNVAVADMERMLHRLIGEDIELRTTLHDDLGKILADPSQTEQVLLNLVVNARDAMPNGGCITIGTANVDLGSSTAFQWPDLRPGRYVMLSVKDTGFGMDAATLSRVFEPFFTTKEQGKGTGLGLSTVYGIVRQSGGAIAVESEMGSGTTFRICMPRIDAEAEAAPEVLSETTEEVPLGRETVLLVEDEEKVRELVASTLRYAGYTVLEGADGIEALEVSRRHPGMIDLLVTDVVMPRLGGGALADALGRERPGIRVIYMSGYTDDDIVRHGVGDQGIPFLQKPFSTNALALIVRRVLDGPPLHPSSPRS